VVCVLSPCLRVCVFVAVDKTCRHKVRKFLNLLSCYTCDVVVKYPVHHVSRPVHVLMTHFVDVCMYARDLALDPSAGIYVCVSMCLCVYAGVYVYVCQCASNIYIHARTYTYMHYIRTYTTTGEPCLGAAGAFIYAYAQ
jgi:hypothetical protein